MLGEHPSGEHDLAGPAASAGSRGRWHQRLSQGRPLIGLLQMRRNPLLMELAGESGYDFLVLDAEHGQFSEDDFAHSVRALAATQVLAMVRLAAQDASALSRYVRMGADAIVVPHVSTVEEATTLVQAMDAQGSAALIVILESALGATHAHEILGVAGVAGALVGPNDLTADLGCPGNYAHPDYAQALACIERAAVATGKALGTVPHGSHTLEALQARGHRWFVLDTDSSLLRAALHAQITRARSTLDTARSPGRQTRGASSS